MNATNTDTQKQDVDGKDFADFAGGDDHKRDKGKKSPNETMCANCGEGHKAAISNCENEIKDRVI